MTILEPIFSTLVRAFYSRMTYRLGRPIISTVRGVEIQLDLESICCIFDPALVGLRVFESKAWPIMLGFDPREAIQMMCGLANTQGMGKPSAHSLTMISQVFHHMIHSILLPRGRHRDEVSYLEAFLVDSILTGKCIHVGYLMMMHMISCCESTTHVLPYGPFLTPWRIAWISIRLASPLSLSICSRDLSVWRIAWISSRLHLSISSRGLSALRIVKRVNMRRSWLTYTPCFYLLSLDFIKTPFVSFLCCQKRERYLGSRI